MNQNELIFISDKHNVSTVFLINKINYQTRLLLEPEVKYLYHFYIYKS